MEWESDSPCHSHTYPRQTLRPPRRCSCWEVELRDCGAIPGRGLLLTVEIWVKGMWGRRFLVGNACLQAAMEARQYCWVMCKGGAVTVASLSPHARISSWATERLARQRPDAVNCSVGPRPGGPLSVPDEPNRDGPQAREPAKCLNERCYGERLAKDAFWSLAARDLEKDW